MGKDMRMFGTNGVRGIINEDLSCELSLRLGKSIGSVMGGTMAIANDPRTSSDMIKFAVMSGLMSVGVNIIDLGMVPTPALQHYVKSRSNLTGGVMITASHNPPEFNGIKCISSDGTECSHEEECKIESTYDGEIPCVKWSDVGTYLRVTDAATEYVQSIVSKVDVEAIRRAGFRVAIDTVNSVGGIILPKLLEHLGVSQVTGLFTEPTGDFGHNPEPLEKNLGDIKTLMQKGGHDVAFVVDPDVDRLAMFCEDGTMYGEEYTLVTVADYILQHTPGNTVSNLSSTRALRDVTRKFGCTYNAAAVGEVNVVTKMKETNAVIGGEGNGGVIYPEAHYGRDALVGIALVLTYLAKTGKTMSQLRATYPQYYMAKNRIDLTPDTDVDAILARVKEMYKDEEVNDIDGVKIDFADSWVHLRKSNTEPIIRVYSEARTAEEADEIGRKVMDVVYSLAK